MRVHFIYTNVGTCNDPHYHNGIGQLSALARREGWKTSLTNCHLMPEREAFVESLRAAQADLYAFSSTSIQWPLIRQMAGWAREAGIGPRIVGGIHTTFLPKQGFEDAPGFEPLWEAVFVGEADLSFPDYLRAFAAGNPREEIEGVWTRDHSGAMVDRGHGRAVDDLDSLPWADRSVFDMKDILRRNGGMFQMKVQRGCPYHCTYCSNAALLDMYGGKKLLRVRSPESVCDELEAMRKEYGFTSVLFDDEMFTMFRPWTAEFCEVYARRCRIPFMISAHFKGVNETVLDQLKAAGCAGIEFGFESGDPKFRKETLRKYFTNEEALEVIQGCRRRGIRVKLNNMYGIPGEREENVDRTLAFLREAMPDVLQATIYNPMPGTELFRKYEEESFAKPLHWIDPGRAANYNGVLLDPGDIRRKQLEFYEVLLHSAIRSAREGSLLDMADDFGGPEPKGTVQVQGPDSHTGLGIVTLAAGARVCLKAHPPARYTWSVTVPQDAVLRFEIGMDAACWDLHQPDEIRFSVGVERPFWARAFGPKKFWDAVISPRLKDRDRTWIPYEVDLALWAGKQVTLVFQTSASIPNPEHATVYWGRPHIDPKSREWRVFNAVSLTTQPINMRPRVDLVGLAGGPPA